MRIKIMRKMMSNFLLIVVGVLGDGVKIFVWYGKRI